MPPTHTFFCPSAAESGFSPWRVLPADFHPKTGSLRQPSPAGFVNLSAAGSCLSAENCELRVLAPSRLRSYFHTRAESWGCHPAACRSLCPSPEQKPARSRAHHPTHGLPSSLIPSSDEGGGNERETSCAPRCSSGDPLPRYPCPPPALSCSLRGRPGVSRAAGCGLRRAPRELLPGRAQVGLRQALALANWASQKRTLLGAHLGNPVLRLSRVYVRPQL